MERSHKSSTSDQCSGMAPDHQPSHFSPPSAMSHDYPLYDPAFEHDACGIGFVANINGRRERRIVTHALTALSQLAHRGAMDADAATSDGAGILAQIPFHVIGDWLAANNLPACPEGELALGMTFLPREEDRAAQARAITAEVVAQHGAHLLGWRAVPIEPAALGPSAQRSCPQIEQAVIRCDAGANSDAGERKLYLIRKAIESRLAAADLRDVYFASFSARTVVYKGLLTASHLAQFYRDLCDPHFESAFAIFHQRYSTNTFPKWPLAQPMRMLAHNGEINTIQGNRNWLAARERSMLAGYWSEEDAAHLHPIIEQGGSDSTSVDNGLELLTRSGRSVLHALTLMAPEVWEGYDVGNAAVRAFYQAQAPMMEPWDGPAALVFSDGKIVGATLDRNGLRPLRYTVTADGLCVLASETGVIPLDESRITEKGRLGPGEMIAVDTSQGVILRNQDIKTDLATRHPYAEWVEATQIAAQAQPPEEDACAPRLIDLLPAQALFGYTHEDVELILKPMATDGAEAVWSMGDDTPLAVLSDQPRPLSSYFKQHFAQVTNPPIDPLRERSVMSLTTYLGARPSAFADTAPESKLLRLDSPVLTEKGCREAIALAEANGMQPVTLPSYFLVDDSDPRDTYAGAAMQRALGELETAAISAVRGGSTLVVISDREIPSGAAPLPMPLALSAVHHALLSEGLRLRTSLVVETGAAWDAHQIALLIGYGANAVCPYLALDTVRAMAGTRGLEALSPAQAAESYYHAIEKGLLKVMSRMGLSVITSYHGAQLFTCIGVDPAIIERYFPGTLLTLSGLTLADLHWNARAQRIEANQLAASIKQIMAEQVGNGDESSERVLTRLRLADRGYVRFRRNAEYHAANPQVVKALQKAAQSGETADYRTYTDLVYARPKMAIRDLLGLRTGNPIPLDEVEPVEAITRRFVSTAMSMGALSQAAHLTLTLGANMVGARSNTGEGGEDEAYYRGERNGISTNSRIKQIASGRFGVTAAYLANAEEIEIKMAQGSKPGEGGQLPSRKVTSLIARLRHTTPGIALISPPPHHDIYSIEDLAQLIYDLKQVNPRAQIGVKLVADRGVGTIAAGVAKGHADYILISGHDGGTGASPLSSIKNVGSPWELGLAETQQTLRLNRLRGRVRLRTDGGLKTGRDVVVAALLGADEYGFGTAAVIALGCDMARQCHLDTCPAGIATQREDLQKKFTGLPEHAANYLIFVAAEVREILAQLGARSLDEIIGRSDLLVAPPIRDELVGLEDTPRNERIDLRSLTQVPAGSEPLRYAPSAVQAQPETLPEAKLLDESMALLEHGADLLLHEPICNSNRTVGARMAGEIAYRWGNGGLPRGTITYHFTGSAGQSFGAWCVPGLRLILTGDANDYIGKGMTGGEIVVTPPPHATFDPHTQVIAGNTVLYGATGGRLFVNGRAGERFAVRNSGAVAVVSSVGDHGCEYMTGGAVVVLGPTGRNFGAGMSGGVAYVYDEEGNFPSRINAEMVQAERIAGASDAAEVAALLHHYVAATNSDHARQILDRWHESVHYFWRVLPVGVASAPPLRITADAGVAVTAH
jgi:glutamate synthase (ferredoxin)